MHTIIYGSPSPSDEETLLKLQTLFKAAEVILNWEPWKGVPHNHAPLVFFTETTPDKMTEEQKQSIKSCGWISLPDALNLLKLAEEQGL